MIDETDKREKERVAPTGQLEGAVMVFQPMTIVEISHNGAQIETPFPLQLDSLHEFRLSLGERSVVVKGRIVHCYVGELRNDVHRLPIGHRVRRAVGARAAGDRDFVDTLTRRAPDSGHHRRRSRRMMGCSRCRAQGSRLRAQARPSSSYSKILPEP